MKKFIRLEADKKVLEAATITALETLTALNVEVLRVKKLETSVYINIKNTDGELVQIRISDHSPSFKDKRYDRVIKLITRIRKTGIIKEISNMENDVKNSLKGSLQLKTA